MFESDEEDATGGPVSVVGSIGIAFRFFARVALVWKREVEPNEGEYSELEGDMKGGGS